MPTDNKNALYGQDTDFHVLATLIPYVSSKTFIDIGAEKGEVARFLMYHGFDGCLFEPLPKHHQVLDALVSQTNSQFLPYAIDDHDHRATLHIATDENNRPMDYFHSLQRLEGDRRVHHNEQLPVECFSIASLVTQGRITDQIGVLKTDTEGNDLNVIVGLGNVRPEVLICEFFTEGLYSGWEDARPEKLIAAAKAKGYNHYISIKRRDGMETTAIGPCSFIDRQWGNLVFMKENVYDPSLEGLLKIIQQCEQKLFDEVEDLNKNCMERLKVINSLVQHNTENG